MKKYLCLSVLALASLLSVTGCTKPGESTKIGTAAGAGIGAGLGAIVGSTTGDAATGLVIGAVAGGGTGALVGNALDSQQEAIKSQDEALERQEHLIRAQSNEIQELRRMSQDGVSYQTIDTITHEDQRIRELKQRAIRAGRVQGNPILIPESDLQARTADTQARTGAIGNPNRMAYGANSDATRYKLKDATLVNKPVAMEQNIDASHRYGSHSVPVEVKPTELEEEARISEMRAQQEAAERAVDRTDTTEVRTETSDSPLEQIYASSDTVEPTTVEPARVEDNLEGIAIDSTEQAGAHLGQVEITPECEKAAQEVRRANVAEDAADKLFHYRRALRYCPHSAEYHNGLGEVYLSLGRSEDARFEFEEALGVDSTFVAAKRNLERLDSASNRVG